MKRLSPLLIASMMQGYHRWLTSKQVQGIPQSARTARFEGPVYNWLRPTTHQAYQQRKEEERKFRHPRRGVSK